MTACDVSIGPLSSVQPDTPKRVIFCDFDGPIVDVSERYYQTYLKGLLAVELAAEQSTKLATAQDPPRLARDQELNLKPLSKSQFWRMKQNRVADLEIAMRSGLPAELFDPFMQQVKRIVNHPNLLRWDSLQPAALGALHYFKQRNIRLVLVTLRHPRQVQAFLRSQGLEPLIDEVFGALDMNAAHANRVEHKCELLMQAIAQQKDLGHLTQNSWMIGDTEADVRAGQLMGLSTAALCCGVRSKTYLQTLSPSKVYGCLMTAALDVVKMPLLQVA